MVKTSRRVLPGSVQPAFASRPKIAGVGQRILARASLPTAVIVVGGGMRLREMLAKLCTARDLPLDKRTAEAITDEHPGLNCETVEKAIVRSVTARYRTVSVRTGRRLSTSSKNRRNGEKCIDGRA